MKHIDALIAERNERLAFIGVDDRCPGTHSPVTSGECQACVANKARAFFRAAAEEDFRRAVSDARAEPLPPCGRVTSESGRVASEWATIKEKEMEFRRRVFADKSLSTLGKLAIISGYNPYPGSPYFPKDQKEPK